MSWQGREVSGGKEDACERESSRLEAKRDKELVGPTKQTPPKAEAFLGLALGLLGLAEIARQRQHLMHEIFCNEAGLWARY